MWVAFCAIGGHLTSWAISGYMAQLVTWRLSFIIPGALLLGFAAIAIWLLRDPEQPLVTAASGDRRMHAMPLKEMFLGTGLWLALISCVASGFMRDGVMTWGPTILLSVQPDTQTLSPTALSLTIPLINLIGVLVGQYLLRRSAGRPRVIIASMMAVSTLVSIALSLYSGASALLYSLLLGACCALMYGVNPLLTVVLPMDYARFGRVGLAAGVIDSCVYLGAALAGVLGGYLKEAYGLGVMFMAWAVVVAIGAAAMLASIPFARKTVEKQE